MRAWIIPFEPQPGLFAGNTGTPTWRASGQSGWTWQAVCLGKKRGEKRTWKSESKWASHSITQISLLFVFSVRNHTNNRSIEWRRSNENIRHAAALTGRRMFATDAHGRRFVILNLQFTLQTTSRLASAESDMIRDAEQREKRWPQLTLMNKWNQVPCDCGQRENISARRAAQGHRFCSRDPLPPSVQKWNYTCTWGEHVGPCETCHFIMRSLWLYKQTDHL